MSVKSFFANIGSDVTAINEKIRRGSKFKPADRFVPPDDHRYSYRAMFQLGHEARGVHHKGSFSLAYDAVCQQAMLDLYYGFDDSVRAELIASDVPVRGRWQDNDTRNVIRDTPEGPMRQRRTCEQGGQVELPHREPRHAVECQGHVSTFYVVDVNGDLIDEFSSQLEAEQYRDARS